MTAKDLLHVLIKIFSYGLAELKKAKRDADLADQARASHTER